MKRLALVLLAVSCSAPPPAKTEPQGPVLVADPSPGPALRFANLRPDGELYVVDVVVDAPVEDVYGVALRLRLDGVRFVRAEPVASDWTLQKTAPVEGGAVVALSSLGQVSGRTLAAGPLLTVWLEVKSAGTLALEAKRSGLVTSTGGRAPVGFGTARIELR
jgi:hypothetical protein